MTTLTNASVLDQTSDAAFQAWGSEFSASLAAVGLTQTTDTGQINWSTVTRASGTNSFAGYEVWKFNDALQSTAPIFIRIRYGNNNYGTSDPGLTIQVGTATDGAGNLTGASLPENCVCKSSSPNNATTYTSRYCYSATQGFLGVAWKIGAGPSGSDQSWGGFYVFRSNDATGAPTAESVTQVVSAADNASWANTNSYAISLNFASGLLYPQITPNNYYSGYGYNWSFWPSSALTTADGADVSVLPGFMNIPKLMATANCGFCLNGEVAVGSTVSVALVGSTAHTYLNVGRNFGVTQSVSNTLPSPAGYPIGNLMLWE